MIKNYVMGIDGGASKTQCIIGNKKGNILANYVGKGSSHQLYGIVKVQQILKKIIERTLSIANITMEQLDFILIGLTGVDTLYDLDLLNSKFHNIFHPIKYKIINDVWIAMRSGLSKSWGAVSICGTGSNAAARHPNGKSFQLRSINYELGNYGGGTDLTIEALHYAFRADEGTGQKTLLVEYLPPLFNLNNMEEFFNFMYPKPPDRKDLISKIPILIFNLANKGDRVCQKILIKLGNILGKMVAGAIKNLNMEKMKVPIVMGGSIYKGNNPLLIDEFTKIVHKTAPNAFLIFPEYPPVIGAYLYALDALNIIQTKEINNNMNNSLAK
ncbi:MAG: ATPase [Candidatus Lokiarchaeota archaeon]|nr:ATPase [Candidatus Lokiarchaeota archaeon]